MKICQKLGVGPGGFYRPGYKDGAKLHLQMMCLGLNWDPQRNCYEVIRSFDGSDVPPIPLRSRFLVQRALQDAHALIRKEYNITKAEDILPPISPNTCIVNFYSAATGKLGLHQVFMNCYMLSNNGFVSRLFDCSPLLFQIKLFLEVRKDVCSELIYLLGGFFFLL